MKSTVACLLLTVCLAAVLVSAEPPVSNYLPPQQQQQPSSQYGAPSGFGASGPSSYQQKPSSQYGAPSNSYAAPPSNSYIPPSPQYGAPSQTSAVYKQPSAQYGAPSGAGGYGGGNNDYESNEPARYSFEYNVNDYQSGNDFGHMESRDGDRTTGRYYVLLPDGRKQIVNYEADQNGYRPTITYEQTNQGNQGGYNANAQSGKFNGY